MLVSYRLITVQAFHDTYYLYFKVCLILSTVRSKALENNLTSFRVQI